MWVMHSGKPYGSARSGEIGVRFGGSQSSRLENGSPTEGCVRRSLSVQNHMGFQYGPAKSRWLLQAPPGAVDCDCDHGQLGSSDTEGALPAPGSGSA
jgi:hypothetical protein